MWPFRRSETPPNASQRHDVTLGLIEELAVIRGKVNALEVEWGDVKETVKKSYQRVERANQRAERRLDDGDGGDEVPRPGEPEAETLHGFAKKLQEMKGA